MKSRIGMVRMATWLVLLLAGFSLCGCYKNKTLVKVNKEGAGNIIVTRVFSKETVDMVNAQMQEMKKYSGEMERGGMKMNAERDPFFDEKSLKKQAKQFGPSVKYVKARKYESGGSRGYVAVYSFKDINEVALNMEKMGQDMERGMYSMSSPMNEDMDEPDMSGDQPREGMIEFKLAKGPSNKLQIMMPAMPDMSEMGGGMDEEDVEDVKTDDKDKDSESENDGREEYMEDMMASPAYYQQGAYGRMRMPVRMPEMFIGVGSEGEAAKRMYKGMQVSVAVEVDGEVVKSNASHVDATKKNRVLLMDMDADKLMATPKGAKLMEKSGRNGRGSPEAMMGLLNKAPGASLETNREVFVEFK